MPILSYEAVWDADNHVGFVRLFLNPAGGPQFLNLSSGDFTAIVALLNTGKALFNPPSQQIYVKG